MNRTTSNTMIQRNNKRLERRADRINRASTAKQDARSGVIPPLFLEKEKASSLSSPLKTKKATETTSFSSPMKDMKQRKAMRNEARLSSSPKQDAAVSTPTATTRSSPRPSCSSNNRPSPSTMQERRKARAAALTKTTPTNSRNSPHRPSPTKTICSDNRPSPSSMQARRKERNALRKQRLLLAESSSTSQQEEGGGQFDDDMSMRIRSLPFSSDDFENNSTASSAITEVSAATKKIVDDAIERIGKVVPSDQAYNDILLLGGGGGEDKIKKIVDDIDRYFRLTKSTKKQPVHKMLSSFRTTTRYQLLYRSEVIYALIASATAISAQDYDDDDDEYENESIISSKSGQTCFCEIRGPILKVRLCNHDNNQAYDDDDDDDDDDDRRRGRSAAAAAAATTSSRSNNKSKVESYSIPIEVLVRKSALLAKQELDETYYGRKEKGLLRGGGGGGGAGRSVGPNMHHHQPKGLASPRSIVSL